MNFFFFALAQNGIVLRKNERMIMRLKKDCAGKRVVIVGNGPSVRTEDLDRLNGETILAANRFYLAYPSTSMRPTATFCVDPQAIENHGLNVAKNCGTPFLVPDQYARLIPDTDELNNLTLFKKRNNQDIGFSLSPFSGLSDGASVIYIAIQFAVWMGATKVVLYGIDHDFIIPGKNETTLNIVQHEGEKNHFIPGYRDKGEKWWPPDMVKITRSFECARDYAMNNNLEILNATRGGSLEVFDRVLFEEEFKKPHRL